MRSRNRCLHLSCLAALLHAPVANAQVGLQVRSGNLWGATVSMAALEPVNLRWKWDGVGTPTRVVWQLAPTTSTSTTTSRDNDPIAQEGSLRVPSSGGVYQVFSVTPSAGTRLPFYIRVRVENAGKAVYSRWITVNAATRAAPVLGASGTTQPPATEGVTAAPLPTAADVTDAQAIRVLLTGIEAWSTATVGYDGSDPVTLQRVNIDFVYVLVASVEFNWADLAKSEVAVRSTPVLGIALGKKINLQTPIWPPSGTARPIKGDGENVAMMHAIMHRYHGPPISITQSFILSEIKNRLNLPAPFLKSDMKELVLNAFNRGIQKATATVSTPDRPVEGGEHGWGKLVWDNLYGIGDQLEAARAGKVVPWIDNYGNNVNKGGRFRLHLEFRR